MTSPSNSSPGGTTAAGATVNQALVSGYLADNPNLSAGALSAARHLLRWATDRQITISDLDARAVDRFARHRCRCGRYSAAQLRNPSYMTDARKFLRYLEGIGRVAIPAEVAPLGPHLADFSANLVKQGYSKVTYSSRMSQARHFAEWILQMRVPADSIDDDMVARFAHHDCQCGIKTKRGKRVIRTGAKDRRRGALAFVAFLRVKGLIPPTKIIGPMPDPRLAAFDRWLRQERGATAETVRRYLQELGRWLERLGNEPQELNATVIRSIVLDQGEDRSRSSVRMTVTVLRAFLRFMIGQRQCAPSLLFAVPSGVRRKLSTVPRTIPASTIEEIVASCGTGTGVEVRDRAIILLLARMAPGFTGAGQHRRNFLVSRGMTVPRTDRGRKLGRRCCAQAVEAKTSFGQISPSQRSFRAEPGQGRNADRGEPEGPVRKTGRASQARTPDRIQACLRTPLPCGLTANANSTGFQPAIVGGPACINTEPSGRI